jgi:hypothetical protein
MNGNWQNKVTLSFAEVISGREDVIFFQICNNQSPRPGVAVSPGNNWGFWDIRNDRVNLLPKGPENIKPIQMLSDGTVLYHKPILTAVHLYIESPGKQRKLVYRQRGFDGYHYLDDGTHVYYQIPKLGSKESPYFKDYILNSPATLYYVKPGSAKRKLVTEKTVQNVRFVDNGKFVVYWRPGRVDNSRNEKYWILESITIQSGDRKEIAEVSGKIQNGSIDTPHSWFFEKSPWIMFEKRMVERNLSTQFIVYNVQTGEKKNFSIPYKFNNAYDKNEIFTPIGNMYAHVYYPYVIGNVNNRMKVWRISDLSVVMEIPIPRDDYYPLSIKGAIYVPY